MRGVYFKSLLLTVLSLVAFSSGSFAQQIIFGVTNVWTYNANNFDGELWTVPAFDDSTWESGPGILYIETGNPGGDLNALKPNGTLLPGTSGALSPTYYFRTSFNYSGPTTGISLILSNRIDDGAVWYLNGVEIARLRLTEGQTYDSLTTAGPPGGDTAAWENLIVTGDLLTNLVAGTNVMAVEVHQSSVGSSDIVFGTTLSVEQSGIPPGFAIQPTNIVVAEGGTATFTAGVTGSSPLFFQWFLGSEPILDATNAIYTISDVRTTNAGTYHLEVSNAISTATSANVTLTVLPDTNAPTIISACVAVDNVTITIKFSEEMDTNGPALLDPLSYEVRTLDNSITFIPATASVPDARTVILTLGSLDALDPEIRYKVVLGNGFADRFGNVLPAQSQAPIFPETTLQEGLNEFAGTLDTEVRFSAPDTPLGEAASINSDLDDGGQVHALIRFDVFGNNPGQVPFDATIHSAVIMINQTDPTDAAPTAWPTFHRMLVPWDESSTWNSLVNGVTADGIEAVVTADAAVPQADQNGPKMIDVTATVQLWATNGAPNHGWTLLPHVGNGFDFDSSEAGTQELRPKLIVCYSAEIRGIGILQQPQSTNVMERQPVTLTVVVRGSNPQFQWRRNGVDIPGANAATYVISNAVPANAGTYTVFVTNNIPSSALSTGAVVTVVADNVRPAVVNARGEANLTNVTIVFSEPVTAATAANPTNYSLAPTLAVSSATLVNPTTVLLTTAPRTFPNNYTLTIRDINDTAVTPNVLNPNPTVLAIPTRAWLLVGHEETWRYEQTNNLHLAAPPWPNVPDAQIPTEGPGLFGLESTGVVSGLNFPNPQIRTPLTIGTNQPTYYFRKMVNLPTIPAGAIYAMRFVADDSLVAYVDGAEAFRVRYTNALPAYDFSFLNAPEGTVECAQLNVGVGAHRIDVELHNLQGASSDILFGAEIVALIRPSLGISQEAGGIRVRWDNDPNWQLVSSTNVTGPYTAVAGNPAGFITVTNAPGNAFYQLLCR